MSPKLVRKCRGVTEKGRKTKKSRGGGGVLRRKCRGGGGVMRRKCRGGGGHQNRCENVGGSPKRVGRQKKI